MKQINRHLTGINFYGDDKLGIILSRPNEPDSKPFQISSRVERYWLLRCINAYNQAERVFKKRGIK